MIQSKVKSIYDEESLKNASSDLLLSYRGTFVALSNTFTKYIRAMVDEFPIQQNSYPRENVRAGGQNHQRESWRLNFAFRFIDVIISRK